MNRVGVLDASSTVATQFASGRLASGLSPVADATLFLPVKMAGACGLEPQFTASEAAFLPIERHPSRKWSRMIALTRPRDFDCSRRGSYPTYTESQSNLVHQPA